MATRMQQRRGTAGQWSGANPILNAGEIGFESDTNKFKIGDGTNHWADLSYFADVDTLGTALSGSYLEVTDIGQPSGPAGLDGSSNLIVPGASIIVEGTTANAHETTLTVTDPTADRTITFPDSSGTVVLADGSGNVTVSGNLTVQGTTTTVDSTTINVVSSFTFEGSTADSYETTLSVTDPTADRTITLPDASGTVVLTTTLDEMAQDAINTALVAGTGLDKTYDDGANTITIDIDSTVTTNSGSQTLTNKTISLSNNTVSGTTAEFNTALTDSNFVTTGDTGTVTSTMIADGTIVDGDINASAAIALSKLATDPLARANHTGTQTASTISDFDTQVRTSRLDQMAAPTASVSLNSQKITSLATPTDSTDAATKAYVDAVTEGLHIHPSVVAATTANITLSTDVENGDTLDGVTLSTGDRILVKNQSTASENGIYVVAASGAPSRATDFDSSAEIDGGDFVFVTGGTANDNTGWVQTNTVGTVGTDAIAFSQFSGAGTYTAGTGLSLNGTVFSINTGTTIDTSTAQTLSNKTLSSPVVTGTITAGGGVGSAGQYLESTGTGVQWTTVTGYAAPTLGSTSIASGATVTTIAGLTLTAPTLTGTVTASGDINLSAANGPGSLIDELALIIMGAL